MTALKPDTTLDALRREIDLIDDQILALLERRFAATGRVKATKAQDGSIAASPFRPAREASMLRRLVSEGGASVSPETLVRLWRVILSASTQSQAPVTLHMDRKLGADLDARIHIAQHFCGMAAELHESPTAALAAVNARRGDLGILAAASDWASAFAPDRGAQVIGTLPVLAAEDRPSLLVFGHAEPQPSGDDETLVILPGGLKVPCCLWQAEAGDVMLAGLQGFLTPEDPVLSDLQAGHHGLRIAGRYPRPIKVSP